MYLFSKNYLDLLNKSEIRTIFNAGCLALPKLIKYNSITKSIILFYHPS